MKYAVQCALRNETFEDREAAAALVLDDEARLTALGQISGETNPRELADGDLDGYHSWFPRRGRIYCRSKGLSLSSRPKTFLTVPIFAT